ncbi:hypothetical protein LK542_01030 [Massilia sp. IC2-477]|uniref:hypothetical protein n=1 Tax=Massilia sp. IC2-477 TaxID=2887198 RepID=UPI001D0F7127|nr:hypothetical protein [Massilia sp. IC2-477]MCC2954194.1 hypothetical protein [Massilia sp. IC2-477]
MGAKNTGSTSKPTAQEVCIDLPGERVQCWRSADNVKVILRKHRDVFFDINLKSNAIYTVESQSAFYSPREKKLLKTALFLDGERFHLWVGRDFKGHLVLSADGAVIGRYEVSILDSSRYGSDPKEKPEPLLVAIGARKESFSCTAADPLGVAQPQLSIFSSLEPKLPLLTDIGRSRFDYSYTPEPPEIAEYVAVVDVEQQEIRPEVLKQLESGAVTGTPSQVFTISDKTRDDSKLIDALAATATAIAGSSFVTSNEFKETAGYLQENLRTLDKLSMVVRIEKKTKGAYKAILKGKPISRFLAESAGLIKTSKTVHKSAALGSEATKFLDGGFGRTGMARFGGARRIMLTTVNNFKGGLKIQVVGTIIDLFVDAHNVYVDEKGSRDLSEFLGRAGVSIAKAGATAAIGSAIAAISVAGLTALAGGVAVPVAAVVLVVVGGYIAAAYAVDKLDNAFKIKQSVAELAR